MDVCGNNSSQTPGKNDRKEGVVEEVTIIPRVRSDCNKPIAKGICSGSLKMYGYDMKSGECHDFTYSGCAGNSNRFFTLSSCKSVCETGVTPYIPSLKRPRLRYISSLSYHILPRQILLEYYETFTMIIFSF